MVEEHVQISRRVGTISFFTLVSRFFGLARDIVLAWAFGATLAADAFYVAFRIPNLLRRLVAEGSMTISFVPVFTEYLKKSRQEAKMVASIVFTCLSAVLIIIVILGVVFAPWIVRFVAYGFETNPEKFALTVSLTRIMFPYIFMISLVAFSMGILNSLKRFFAPAASPILLNLAIIFGAVVLKGYFKEPTYGVAAAVLIGGLLQMSLQMPYLAGEGMIPRPMLDLKHPAMKSLLLLMIPSAYGAAVYQVNVLVITFLASFLPHGSVSYLWYADRIAEFPLGIFSIAVATAILPTLSDHAADKNTESFKKTINYGLRLAFLIDIPAAVGLYILSSPIVRVIFERGVFSHDAASATAGALKMFALGIPFVSGVRNLVPAFFAMRNPKTPVVIATLGLISNAVLAVLLMKSMLHVGLALAMASSSVINFVVLLFVLRLRIGKMGGKRILYSVLRTAFAVVCMSLFILSIVHFAHLFEESVFLKNIVSLLFLITGSFIIYIGIIRVISPNEYRALSDMIRRRTQIIPQNDIS